MKNQWVYKLFSAMLIVLLVVMALPVKPARAATFTVTKITDTNDGVCNADCSLREAVFAANAAAGADTIVLTSGLTYALNLTMGATGDLDITSSITIQTTGVAVAIIDPAMSFNERVFDVTSFGNLSLQNIRVTTASPNEEGAVIRNQGGIVTINNSTFDNNSANGNNSGGVINQTMGTLTITNSTFRSNGVTGNTNGGAIIQTSTGTISITDSTFELNTAGGNSNGGAIAQTGMGTLTIIRSTFTSNASNNNGGAIYILSGSLSITDSTFSSNSATDGGAINIAGTNSATTITGSTFINNSVTDDGGAIRNNGEPLRITNSVFQGNITSSSSGGGDGSSLGGAIRNEVGADQTSIFHSTFINNSVTHTNNQNVIGGAIANEGANLILANLTFSGNSVSETNVGGGGNAQGGAVYSNGNTTIHNVTFSGNSATEAGSGSADGGNLYRNGGTITVRNTILVNGLENALAGNCGGTLGAAALNASFADNVSTTDCGAAVTTGSPNLGVLTGSPQYFPLNTGSSAINTGNNAICATVATTNNQSQNGLTRPVNLICDIGSYESPNTPPTTSGITNINTLEDAANTIFSLYLSFADAEDTDAQLTYTVTGNSNVGLFVSIDINDPTNFTLDYAPDKNGNANITIRATDRSGEFVETTFTVSVTAVNDEPNFTTSGNPVPVDEDAGLQTILGWVTTVDFGPDDEDATQTVLGYIISNSTCGALLSAGPTVDTAGTLTYTPALNQNGTCTFDVQVQDDGGTANNGDDTSPVQNFTITVNPINDEPNFTAANPATVNEDAGLVTVLGWVTAVDFGPADEDATQSVLGYIITNSTCGTLLTADPNVNASGDLSYTPAPDQNGTCTFDVQVQDDGGTANGGDDTSPTQNFTITVNPVNDEPNFTAVNPPTINEDAGAQTNVPFVTAVDFGPADEDSSQAVLGYIVTNSTCGTLLTAAPTINASGQISYTPALNQNGTCTFDVQVQDDGGIANGGDDTSPTQNFTITVNVVNDAPTFTASNPTAVNEDAGAQTVVGWATFSAGPADESGQAVLGYTVSNSTCGSLLTADPSVNNSGDLSYTPLANANGTCTFDVAVQDNGGIVNGGVDTSTTQNFTITVNPVNDEPSFTAVNPAAVNEDAGAQTVNSWATFNPGPANESGQTVSQYIISNSTCGTLLSAGPSVSTAGTLTYTPAANQNGTCTFDVAVQDNGGTALGGDDISPTQNFTITINVINDEPSFTAVNPPTVNEDAGAQTVNSWATFNPGPVNESGQAVLQYIISNSTCGTLLSAGPSVSTAGTLTYTPALNQNGTCTFDVAVQDNGGTALGGDDTSPTQNFTITVNPVNDEPSFTAVNPAAVNEDAGAQTVNSWATFNPGPANESGQAVSQYIISNSTCGTLLSAGPSVSTAGALTYTPAADQNGTCTFDVQVQDTGGTALGGDDISPTQNFTITVNAVDDASTANDDIATVWEDSSANTINVRSNDTDIDSGVELIQSVTQPANGTVVITNLGADLTYQPDAEYCNNGTPTDNFTYTLTGGDSATVQMTVTCQTVITANITASDKTYDGNTTASFTCSLTGVVPPDVVSCTGGTATFVDKNANTGKSVTASGLSLTGADAFKYELASTSATDTADIFQRILTVTATGINKVYDGNTNATVTLNDDRVGGDVLTVDYTSASFADPNVGVNILVSVTGISISGGADAGNYNLVNTSTTTNADITIDSQTINVTTPAPANAVNGSSFNVVATATSGLPVAITTSGSCSGGDTDGDATITMTSGTGTCNVFYNQAGNVNYTAASQVQEDVTATDSPVFTSADNTSFDFGFSDTFAITAAGNPSTMSITMTGEPAGITITDNGDGTATLNYDGTTSPGVYTIIFTANNGVAPNGIQTFTLTIRNGPVVNIVNSSPDTGNGSISENENFSTTLGVTQIMVEFNRDVYDDPTDTTNFADDVTNPANYLLVRSTTGTFATVDCRTGATAPDVTISVDSVTYSNGGGSGPFIATLNVNSGLPLNVAGFYRLFVCGTTSIVDATNPLLTLAGNGVTPGTDFTRNFRIVAPVIGGGGGGSSSTTTTPTLTGLLIPVTGFTPSQVTDLPAQPVDKEYAKSELTLKIPSLGMNLPIVGIKLDKNGWDVTWLGNNAGYLEGSAYPTWNGNSILTSHVTDPNGKPGPFAYINELAQGDKVYVHNNGFVYVYEVRQSQLILPTSIKTLFKHEDDAWLTLVTCENYNEKADKFTQRRIVRAVLISIIPEK